MKSLVPYGAWPSPLTAARVTAGALRLDQIQLDGDDVYWVEGRASEGGRYVIVKRTAAGAISDVTPPPFNVRSRAHEYGGAAYTVHDGALYFSNFADQRVYRQAPGEAPEAITPEGYFFADFRVDTARSRLVGVREGHTQSDREPENTIVAISVSVAGTSAFAPGASAEARALRSEAAGTILISGSDFYSDPIVSPDGKLLAWLQWNHPNMPWDGTELWVGGIQPDGSVGVRQRVAGGADESIFQPEWSPDGVLYFVSDRTGWWNLYRTRAGKTDWSAEATRDGIAKVENVHPMAAEFGKPQWTFSMVTYAFISADCVAVTYAENGRWKMALLDTASLAFEPVNVALQPIESIRANERAIYFVGGSATEPLAIARVAVGARDAEVLRSSSSERIASDWISIPEAITYRVNAESAIARRSVRNSPDDAEPREVHAFYYPPKNPDVVPPAGAPPPLLVLTHGGPTGATSDVLDPEIQFWTSRGFAVLDVDYSGSTGYGRAYRDRLKGQWGIADVEDAVGGARAMVARGKADAAKLMIRGGSAGGYTTLAALTFHSTFKAGASYYGISDIEVIAKDTHKFESRYLDSLIGPYPAARDAYIERSPIHFTDRLSCPIILFQGLDDKVVPPNQSALMAEAVRKKGLKVAYVTFEGEQHGFRKAETIIRALEEELAFYREVFAMGSDPFFRFS